MIRYETWTAAELLAELHALVKGECPSLLNEDSGGNGELALAIEDALSSPGAAQTREVPPGWKLVPVQPTEEMLRAGHRQIDYDRTGQNTYELEDESQTAAYDAAGEFVGHVGSTCRQDVLDAYAAMLATAPASQPVDGVQGGEG